MYYPAVEVEVKEIERAKDSLEEAIAKLRKALEGWKLWATQH